MGFNPANQTTIIEKIPKDSNTLKFQQKSYEPKDPLRTYLGLFDSKNL
jgi:hypothetical protein